MITSKEVDKLICQNNNPFLDASDRHSQCPNLKNKRIVIEAVRQRARYQAAIITRFKGQLTNAKVKDVFDTYIFPDGSTTYAMREKEYVEGIVKKLEPKGIM